MRRRIDPPPELLQLAERQGGVVTREQCRGLGVDDHVVRRLLGGDWTREAQGVYRAVHSSDEWLTQAWTGTLLAGTWSMIGGWSAAHLLGLTAERPSQIEIWVRASERTTVSDVRWRFRQDFLDRHSTGTLPVTRVEQTIADCAATATLDQLAALLGKALSKNLTKPGRMTKLVEEQRCLPGRRLLMELIPDVATGAYSALEVRFLRGVERGHGLPTGRRQIRVKGGAVLDVLFDEYGVVVELDGRLGHAGEGKFRDMDRDNRHAAQGLLTLRFGWTDVLTRPCEVARQIADALTVRGWTGSLTCCPSCAA